MVLPSHSKLVIFVCKFSGIIVLLLLSIFIRLPTKILFSGYDATTHNC